MSRIIAATVPAILLGLMTSKPLLVAVLFVCGIGAGYMVLFLSNMAEQFGTSVRGIATVLAPNVMRAAAIPMTLSVHAMQGRLGLTNAALVVGVTCVAIALLALHGLPETFGRDLDFDEPATADRSRPSSGTAHQRAPRSVRACRGRSPGTGEA